MTATLRTLITVIAAVLFSTLSAKAMDVNPGPTQMECPGVIITLGGNASRPTAGPGPLEDYTIVWSCSPGSWTSNEANPEVVVPDVETVYTVRVTDKDGFTCMATVKVVPVVVKSVKFTPEQIPADGKSTSQGSVTVEGVGRNIVWSIVESDGTGASVNETSGLVKAGSIPGTVRVKAQDKKAADSKLQSCAAEENLCIGDPESCCPDLSGELTFGMIKVKLNESIKPIGVADAEGFCPYSTNKVLVSIAVEGYFTSRISYDVEGVTVSWSEKIEGGTRRYKDVKLSWKGVAPTRKFGAIMANLTDLEVGVTSSGVISGDITFTVNQTEPVELFGKFAILAKGTSGKFTFRYNSSLGGFNGDYDFEGIRNVVIQLRKNKIIAEAKGSMNKDGDLTAEFIAKDPVEYGTKGFNATLKKLSWKFTWKIRDNDLVFKTGQADVVIKKIKNTKGEVDIKLDLNGTEVEGAVSFEKLTAFGCTIAGKLNASMTYDFELTEIEGKSITAKHSEFDAAFAITDFKIINGELTVFNFNGRAKYSSIFFDISSASYRSDKSALALTAMVKIGNSSQLKVTDFLIAGEEGTVSVGKLDLEIEQFPLKIKGSLSFSPEGFKGTYSGSIKGGVSIGGKVALGAMDDYNYGFFEMEMKSAQGFPVGPVVRIDQLGGRFGYNYNHNTGRPVQGRYVIGFMIGIKDAANIVGVEGDVELVIGSETALNLAGEVRVPARSPHYFKGGLEISYLLGGYDISGFASVALKIPARNGAAVSLNSGRLNFKLNEAGWSVKANNMKGKIMNTVDMTATIDLRESSGNSDGITGRVGGAIDYKKEVEFIYPAGFDTTNCVTADDTDNLVGFGIYGYLNVELGGSFDAQVDADGFTGAVKANASGDSRIKVKWPCITCGDCLKTGTVSISGEVEIKYENNVTVLEGNLTFRGTNNQRENRYVEIQF